MPAVRRSDGESPGTDFVVPGVHCIHHAQTIDECHIGKVFDGRRFADIRFV